MKQLLFVFSMIMAFAAHAQEFTLHNNGLIYSDSTMSQLSKIVKQENLKFKTCDLHPVYYSLPQAEGVYVFLSEERFSAQEMKEAQKEMENGISVTDFIKKYPKAAVRNNLFILKTRSKNYDDVVSIVFESIEVEKSGYEIYSKNEALYHNSLEKQWVTALDEDLEAFYFEKGFVTPQIPAQYANWIQYGDCMVDTSTQIYYANAGYEEYAWRENTEKDSLKKTNRDAFYAYIKKENEPRMATNQEYLKGIEELVAQHKSEFLTLLQAAIEESIRLGIPDSRLEVYAGKYISRKEELRLRRLRRVMGFCSQDSRPREHAQEMAVLAAETYSWEIFLRAHLDIMNDRFERASDGSYAWGRRNTYIKELEELDINVLDLLIGACFRFGNPAENHYTASVGRTGRALAETQSPAELEKRLSMMIEDEKLDNYNRMIISYLYLNYIGYSSKEKQQTLVPAFKESFKKLPSSMAGEIHWENWIKK